MNKWKVCALGVVVSVACFAKPTGFRHEGSGVKVHNTPKGMWITAGKTSVIEWNDFSVGSREKIEFRMLNPKLAVLNRVVGKNKSVIHGQIKSNGRVYLVNQNGILIGSNALIKTAGFFATTGQIDNQQFLAGKDILITGLDNPNASIDNLGTIETEKGDIYLVSSKVVNQGKLSAPEGYVGIGVGTEVLIKPNGPERIFIKAGTLSAQKRESKPNQNQVEKSVQKRASRPVKNKNPKWLTREKKTETPVEEVVEIIKDLPKETTKEPAKDVAIDNQGIIQALITEIKTHSHPYTEAISHSGIIEGTALKRQRGRVLLLSEDKSVKCSGKIYAPGGLVKVDAADSVELQDTAHIDVSSGYSPGSAMIGSRNAHEVMIGTNARIQADNLTSGNGGSVTVLSKSATKFSGTITAEAKGLKGNGGKVEVSSSGEKGLTFKGKTSLKSAHGRDGQLLLDPKFAIIRSGGTDPATGNTFDNDPQGTVTISGADLSAALNSASVTIQANTDITLDDVITSSTNGNGLTFQAGRSVIIDSNSSITLNNGAFYCIINDENALLYERLAGGAGLFSTGPNTINTQGGDVTFDVGTFGGVQGGTMNLINTMIDAGGGNIVVNGYGCMENARGLATNLAECTHLVTSGSGTIDVTGTAVSAAVNDSGPNAGVSNNFGIFATGLAAETNLIQTENGAITITGTGASIDLGYNNGGTYLSMTQVKTTGTGTITINGTAGSGQTQNLGVVLNGPMGLVSSNTGSIQITGVAKGTEQGNMGISIETGAQVVATGAADITIHGTGGNGTSLNLGVAITTQESGVSSEGGSISITGIAQGSNNSNQGFNMSEGCFVKTTGTGVITINGTGSGAGNSNMGAVFNGKTLEVTSVDGDINITGTGAGAGPSNSGVYIQYPGSIATTGSGVVNITDNTP